MGITKEDAELFAEMFKSAGEELIPTPDEVMRVWKKLDIEIGGFIKANKTNPEERKELAKQVFAMFLKLLKELRDIRQKYKPMPTGTAVNTLIGAMDAGQNGQQGLDEWLRRKNKISHTKDTITRGDSMNGDGGKIIFRHDISDGRGYVKLKMPESTFDELVGFRVAPKKILVFLLEKVNEQAFHDGKLTRNYVDFSAKELIERGVYKTRQSALKGLKAAMNILTGIQIEGEYHFGKNNTVSYVSSNEGGNIFRFWQHDKGLWRVYIEENADWRFILQSFSRLPSYYYRLPFRASELLYLIRSIARQRTKDIKERGYFTISLRTIQQVLNLPDEDKTTHPQRDIKDVINDAVDEIDKAQREDFGNEDLQFLSVEYDEAWPIKQFLNEGYLYVALSGDFAQPFIDIEDEKTKKLKEVKRRSQKALAAKKDNDEESEKAKKDNDIQKGTNYGGSEIL